MRPSRLLILNAPHGIAMRIYLIGCPALVIETVTIRASKSDHGRRKVSNKKVASY